MTIDWTAVARRLGYKDEHSMWQELYLTQDLSISNLAERFGVSGSSIRNALLRCDVSLRSRGGPNGSSVPPGPSDLIQQVQRDGVSTVSKRLGITQAAVYKRLKKLRLSKEAV